MLFFNSELLLGFFLEHISCLYLILTFSTCYSSVLFCLLKYDSDQPFLIPNCIYPLFAFCDFFSINYHRQLSLLCFNPVLVMKLYFQFSYFLIAFNVYQVQTQINYYPSYST